MAYIVTSCTYMYFKSRNYWYINFALPVIILLEIKWPITSNHLVNSSWLSKPSTSGTFEFGRCVNFPVSSSLSSLSSEGTSCVERLCSFGEDLIICINVRVEVLLIKINTTLELQMKEKATCPKIPEFLSLLHSKKLVMMQIIQISWDNTQKEIQLGYLICHIAYGRECYWAKLVCFLLCFQGSCSIRFQSPYQPNIRDL